MIKSYTIIKGDIMVDYVIETTNLSKTYSKDLVVNSIDMHVEKGKIYGLLGKNGAGKTTTMSMLLNLVYPSGGEILLFGKDPRKYSKEIYSRIGSIIETPGFYENLTAYENLKIIAKLRGDYNPLNIELVLEMLNLDKEKTKEFKDFSLGMKQRLALAAAIMHNPELLILDEPINGLDPFGIKEIRDLLKKLSSVYGVTILISSHILSEIENIADVIGFMENGILIEEISKEELYERLDKFVGFEVSDIDLAVELLNKIGFKESIDFTFRKSLGEYIDDVESNGGTDRNSVGGTIHLFSNLDLRDQFNTLFVSSGINVNKVNLCEENLEDFFRRIVSNS
ncbi:ABC-2 type transport system ATP-binding protein [Methanobrevibacter olleyae]|uniref:ABC-2 type transport system ATP-binding protein n=2 Tax=Methanobrevibacter olleyae TaxID=294671 RepID=A0A1I4KFN6_METOL|nr:ABC-2 type transport system ATP-binding protein [Methanobrevibacter olleyae]